MTLETDQEMPPIRRTGGKRAGEMGKLRPSRIERRQEGGKKRKKNGRDKRDQQKWKKICEAERDAEEENDTSETAQTSEAGPAGNTTESEQRIPVRHLEARKPLQILNNGLMIPFLNTPHNILE